jgi:hypothetical protein
MAADALGRVIHCPHCGQEISLDEAIVNQFTEPMRAIGNWRCAK